MADLSTRVRGSNSWTSQEERNYTRLIIRVFLLLQDDLEALLREQLQLEDSEVAPLMDALKRMGVRKAEVQVP